MCFLNKEFTFLSTILEIKEMNTLNDFFPFQVASSIMISTENIKTEFSMEEEGEEEEEREEGQLSPAHRRLGTLDVFSHQNLINWSGYLLS